MMAPSPSAKTLASVLDFIDRHICVTGGISPTFREIAKRCDIRGPAAVQRRVESLEACGLIRRVWIAEKHGAACFEVVQPRYRLPSVTSIYIALGSKPIGKIGDGRKVAA